MNVRLSLTMIASGLLVAGQFIGWPISMKVALGCIVWSWASVRLANERDAMAALFAAGVACNSAAIIANGGFMPVPSGVCDLFVSCTAMSSWWRPLTAESRLVLLTDIFPPWGTSLGDWVIVSQLPIWMYRVIRGDAA
mgnify:FL=1